MPAIRENAKDGSSKHKNAQLRGYHPHSSNADASRKGFLLRPSFASAFPSRHGRNATKTPPLTPTDPHRILKCVGRLSVPKLLRSSSSQATASCSNRQGKKMLTRSVKEDTIRKPKEVLQGKAMGVVLWNRGPLSAPKRDPSFQTTWRSPPRIAAYSSGHVP